MIYGFFGDIGSGKTLSLTRYAWLHSLLGYKVFSNYKLSFPHTLIDSDFLENVVKKDLNFTGNTIFCLDEFDMYVDSRSSMSKQNKLISYFIKQVRKKNIKLLYSAQMQHTIDKRLRGLTHSNILCRGHDIVIYKKGVDEPVIIKVIYNDVHINNKCVSKMRFVGNKYFNKYDTRELITYEEKENIKK